MKNRFLDKIEASTKSVKSISICLVSKYLLIYFLLNLRSLMAVKTFLV